MRPFLAPLSLDAEKIYIERCRKGDAQARSALIEHNLRLVAHIAKKYTGTVIEQEEYISVGVIGLCKAVDSFSSERGNKLATYAARCIENEMLMLLRQERKRNKDVSLFEPVGQDKDGNEMSFIDLLETADASMDEGLWQKQMIEQLPTWIESVLTPQEKRLIQLRYGLGGCKEKTQREIGEIFGISRSYVSRLEKKALDKLRRQVNVNI